MGAVRVGIGGILLSMMLFASAITVAPAQADGLGSYAWGKNSTGELGIGTTSQASDVPVRVDGLGEVTQLAAGNQHSLALVAGEVMAWGANEDGQLGDGGTEMSDVPTPVSGLSGVTAIAAGSNHSLALLSDGTVMAWGANEDGQLGDASSEKSTVPVAVTGLSGVTAIAAGGNHSLALLSDGTVMAWGANEDGQLGDGGSENSTVPVAVTGLDEVAAISAGFDFSLALLRDGEARTWGRNLYGELGAGSGCSCTQSSVPVAVSGLSEATAVSAADQHALALLRSGTVLAWGENKWGELGDNGFESSDEPVAVQELSGVTQVAAGGLHSVALLSDGKVMSWGGNEFGELGNGLSGKGLRSPLPVATACALHGIAGIASGFWGTLAWGGENELCPQVSGVAPDEGPPAGGTSVTISGMGFEGATAVKFGSAAASSFTVESSTTIRAVSPAGAETVDVTVTTPAGSSSADGADRFTYGADPTLTHIAPDTGPAGGGQRVTLTGTHLGNVTAVDFGAAAASQLTIDSSTEVTVRAPAGSGTVNVTATNSSGTSEATSADLFTYVQAPEFGTCVSVGNGHGRYSTNACLYLGEAKTGYEWYPAFGGSRPLRHVGFSLSSTALKLETTAKKLISCKAGTTTGEYASAKTVAVSPLTLTGCHEGASSECQSAGAGEGEVKTNALAGLLGYIKAPPGPKVGLELSAAGGSGALAEFTCSSAPVTLRGSVILEVKANVTSSTGSWKASQSKGKQKPTHFEGGPEATLEVQIGSAASYEPAGLAVSLAQHNEEAVEINSQV